MRAARAGMNGNGRGWGEGREDPGLLWARRALGRAG
jgi:hypothetical protein